VVVTTPDMSQDEEIGYIQSQGQRVHYRVRGDGPPLLMIHGVGASLELWRPLEARLSDFRTITVDPPGAGRSSTPRGRFGMRQFANVMDDLLEHLGVRSAHVLGLSLGGMMAQELARQHPQHVHKLVLASTTCGWGGVPANPLAMAVIATPARYYSSRHFKQVAPLLYGRRVANDPALLEHEIEIRRHHRPSLPGYFIQMGAAWTWSSRTWLGTLDMPVLAISGSDDQIVPPANSRLIARAVRNGRVAIIEGGGHLCVIQEPARSSELIRDHLLDG
jgi:pimeloyl-ACP methyl ester carboxylesterase